MPGREEKESSTLRPAAKAGESLAIVSPKNTASLTSLTNTLRAAVGAIVITNKLQCENARTLLTRIITAKKKAQVFIQPVLDNAKEGLRLAKEQERTLIAPLMELETSTRTVINAYLTEEMWKARALQEEQDEKKRVYEEKVAASKRPERIKQPVIEEVVAPKLEDTSIPMVPKYEITDEALIPDCYCKRVIDREKLWDTIRVAHKEGVALVIPGVRIWEEAQIGVRRG